MTIGQYKYGPFLVRLAKTSTSLGFRTEERLATVYVKCRSGKVLKHRKHVDILRVIVLYPFCQLDLKPGCLDHSEGKDIYPRLGTQ